MDFTRFFCPSQPWFYKYYFAKSLYLTKKMYICHSRTNKHYYRE